MEVRALASATSHPLLVCDCRLDQRFRGQAPGLGLARLAAAGRLQGCDGAAVENLRPHGARSPSSIWNLVSLEQCSHSGPPRTSDKLRPAPRPLQTLSLHSTGESGSRTG